MTNLAEATLKEKQVKGLNDWVVNLGSVLLFVQNNTEIPPPV